MNSHDHSKIFLFQALILDVFLQIAELLRYCGDSLSEGEIIPLSGVSKSGAGSIAHAAGAGRSARWTSGVELQPTLASNNIALKLIDSGFSICQFSRVFGTKCSNVALAHFHVADCAVCQLQVVGGFITLVFEGDRVIAVMVNCPGDG